MRFEERLRLHSKIEDVYRRHTVDLRIVRGGGSPSPGRPPRSIDRLALATATGGAPSGRSDYTVVRTGTEMIVRGGSPLDTGDGTARTRTRGSRRAARTGSRLPARITPPSGPDSRWTGWWCGEEPITAPGGHDGGAPCTPRTWYRGFDGDGSGFFCSTPAAGGRPAGYAAASSA